MPLGVVTSLLIENADPTPLLGRPLEHFLGKCGITEQSYSCWLWTGWRNEQRGGYGYYDLPGGNSTRAHRISYEVFMGPIPDKLTIDHICVRPSCVNPVHLEPVTREENERRRRIRRQKCRAGHVYPADVRYTSNGWRRCLVCSLDAARRQFIKKGGIKPEFQPSRVRCRSRRKIDGATVWCSLGPPGHEGEHGHDVWRWTLATAAVRTNEIIDGAHVLDGGRL